MPSLFWRFTGDTVGDTVNTPKQRKKNSALICME